MSPHPRRFAFAAALTALAWMPGIASAEAQAGPLPEWFLEHNDFMARDGGRFETSNADYQSEQEPWEAYGMVWEKGPTGHTVRGRLFGIRDGQDTAPFWEFYVYWHPGEGAARILQVNSAGTAGLGTIDPPDENGAHRMDQTFHNPDGTTMRMGHITANTGDTHDTQSLRWVEGEWQPNRHYLWKRVGATSEPAAKGASKEGEAGGESTSG